MSSFDIEIEKATTPDYPGTPITFVAPGSIAALQGIEVGDLMLYLDEEVPSSTRQAELNKDTRYTIFQAKKDQKITLICRGIAPGIAYKINHETVLQSVREGSLDMVDFASIFPRTAKAQLIQILETEKNPPLMARIVAGIASLFASPKAYKRQLQSILDVLNGHYDAAETEIVRFIEEDAPTETTNIRAMYHSMLGDIYLSREDSEEAAYQFQAAYYFNSVDFYLEKLKELGVEPEYEPADYVGATLNLDFNLPSIFDSVNRVNFKKRIASLGEGEFYLIALMGPYRTNGPYHWSLANYCTYKNVWPDKIKYFDVITEIRKEPEYWHKNEAQLLKQGQINDVLVDLAPEPISKLVGINYCPTYFLLDQDSVIRYHGRFTDPQPLFELIGEPTTGACQPTPESQLQG